MLQIEDDGSGFEFEGDVEGFKSERARGLPTW